VQCIAYYSQFALDRGAHVVNNKVLIIPADDLYLLSVLNSRISWWIINRTFQHMKDEGLSVDVQFLRKLPVPNATPELRRSIHDVAARMLLPRETLEIAPLELQLDALVQRAFELTSEEQRILVENLPPRDPISALICEPGSPAVPSESDGTLQAPRRRAAVPRRRGRVAETDDA